MCGPRSPRTTCARSRTRSPPTAPPARADGDLELQVLRGLGDDLAAALADQGMRVRIYCPVGDMVAGHGLPRPAAAREHRERVVPERHAARGCRRGAAGGAMSFRNEPILELRRAPVARLAAGGAARPGRQAAARGSGPDRRRAGPAEGLDSTDPGAPERLVARAGSGRPGGGRGGGGGGAARLSRVGRAAGVAAGRGAAGRGGAAARAPARAGRPAGARVRQALAGGRRRRVRGDRLPRVLRARGDRAGARARADPGAGRAQPDALRRRAAWPP